MQKESLLLMQITSDATASLETIGITSSCVQIRTGYHKATGDMPSNAPPDLGVSGDSSSTPTPVETFKRSIKRYSSQFTNFKDGKH